MNNNLRNITLWLVIFLAFILVAQQLVQRDKPEVLPLTQLLDIGDSQAEGGPRILSVKDRGGVLEGKMIDEKGLEQPFKSEYIATGDQGARVLEWARANQIEYKADPDNQLIGQLFISVLLPIGILVLIWIFFIRHIQGGGANKAMSFGKSRAKLFSEAQGRVTFEDVAGIQEVKEELVEIIQFLKDPQKFSRLGGKIPKGALLYGPPGTGKTLIARAVACEAGVPFFSISGSDFVEMFVGVGASRVRDLFEQGKRAAPCVIYIDEIDAVGRKRFSGIGGGHDEREQTLNQLLVELDGFAPNTGIIVMASTNRPDVLDPALLRPGRFDRQISVPLPDIKGREKILRVHTRELKVADGISYKRLAQGTPGFSGADLANLANEAALLAARKDKEAVDMSDLDEAKDRVMMGPERRSLVMSEKERRNTAYHEAGHALVSKLTPERDDDVHKVTIMPRGRSLGLTHILPEEDRLSMTRRQILNSLYYLMGGRAAEQVKFDEFTTGAANDLQRATELARRMVCEFGMSEKLGPRTLGSGSSPLFLGQELASHDREYSDETARLVDAEIEGILNNAYEGAHKMLTDNMGKLEAIAQALLERETLSGEELDKLLAGESLPPLGEEPPEPPQSEAEAERRHQKKRKTKNQSPSLGLGEAPGAGA